MHGAFAAAVIAVTSLTTPQPGEWTPDARTILKLEAAIRMPPSLFGGRLRLTEYDRFYAGTTENGRRLIYGHLSLAGTPSIHVVHLIGLPLQLDGGCSFVDLVYDVARARVTSIRCNGVA